jgi:hypothetical protein
MKGGMRSMEMVTVYFTQSQLQRWTEKGETDVILSQVRSNMHFTTQDKIVAQAQIPADWIKADFGNGTGFIVKGDL